MLKALGGGGSSGPVSGGGTIFGAAVTTNTTLSPSNTSVLVNAASGNVVITLPTAVGDINIYTVKRIDVGQTVNGNTVTVQTIGGQTIDQALTELIQYQYTSVSFKSDNANWWII